MQTIFRILASALVGVLLSTSALAQTAVTTTTLASAVAATTTSSIVVASATGIAVGRLIYVDRELMRVRAGWVSGTTIPVDRGVAGVVTPHAANAIVYHAPAGSAAWRTSDRAGSCTSTSEAYLPQINTNTGSRWDCGSATGLWVDETTLVTVTCRALLIADMIDQSCFVVDKPYVVTKIQEAHTTAESAGTLTLIVKRQQSTEAAASGDALITALDMVGAGAVAQTLKTATLTTTPAFLLLSAGERLGLDFTDDSAGELAGVTVTITLAPR